MQTSLRPDGPHGNVMLLWDISMIPERPSRIPQLLRLGRFANSTDTGKRLLKDLSTTRDDAQFDIRTSLTPVLTRLSVDKLLYRKQSKFFPVQPQSEPTTQGVIPTTPAQACQLRYSASNTTSLPTTDETATQEPIPKIGSMFDHDIQSESELRLPDKVNAANLWRIHFSTRDEQHDTFQDLDHHQTSVHAYTSDARDCLMILELDSKEIPFCHSNMLTENSASDGTEHANTLASDSLSFGDFVTAISAVPSTATTDCLNELLVDHDIALYDEAYASFEAASVPLPPSPMAAPQEDDECKSQSVQDHLPDSVKTYATSMHVHVDSDTSSDLDDSIFVLPSPVSAVIVADDRRAAGASDDDQDEECSWLWFEDSEAEMEGSIVLIVPCVSGSPETSDIDDADPWTTIGNDESTSFDSHLDCDPVLAHLVNGGG